MKTKIVLASLAALLTTGLAVHIHGHCPMKHMKASTAQNAAAKDAKTTVAINR